MTHINNLENKVVCGLDAATNLPKHAISVPKTHQNLKGFGKYCCDSRSKQCEYGILDENKNYCNYKTI